MIRRKSQALLRVLRDPDGSSLVEFTLVFPVLILITLGTVDFSFAVFEVGKANKAAYYGARAAIVSPPAAPAITNPTYDPLQIGEPCTNNATGASSGLCPAIPVIDCVGINAGGGSCSGGYAFDNGGFTAVYNRMQRIFPRLARSNVQITYRPTGLGFVGRPEGLPVGVTVSVRCLNYKFYFITALAGLAFPAAPQGCPAGTPTGPQIDAFATVLTSERFCDAAATLPGCPVTF